MRRTGWPVPESLTQQEEVLVYKWRDGEIAWDNLPPHVQEACQEAMSVWFHDRQEHIRKVAHDKRVTRVVNEEEDRARKDRQADRHKRRMDVDHGYAGRINASKRKYAKTEMGRIKHREAQARYSAKKKAPKAEA